MKIEYLLSDGKSILFPDLQNDVIRWKNVEHSNGRLSYDSKLSSMFLKRINIPIFQHSGEEG